MSKVAGLTGFWTVLVAGLLLAGCTSSPAQCSGVRLDSYSFITVLAPDGSDVCDATVTADGYPAAAQAGVQDAGCVYAVDNGTLGNGDYEVTASKPGYLDAHATLHISGMAGGCPGHAPVGENITLHLVPAEGGAPDGAADAAAADASSDGL